RGQDPTIRMLTIGGGERVRSFPALPPRPPRPKWQRSRLAQLWQLQTTAARDAASPWVPLEAKPIAMPVARRPQSIHSQTSDQEKGVRSARWSPLRNESGVACPKHTVASGHSDKLSSLPSLAFAAILQR